MSTTGLDIVIASPGLPHHGDTLKERSMGGSETAAIHMAAALTRRGHYVTVCSPGHTGGTYDGVTYLPIEQFTHYATTTPHDVTVISRALELVPILYASSLRILWCHDLALKRSLSAISPGLWNLHAIYVLSEFQRQQYVDTYAGVPPDVYVVTRNGVDLPALAALRKQPRVKRKLVFGSRPERGLEAALLVMRDLARRQVDATLHVAWYDNVPAHIQDYYQYLWRQAAELPNVKLLGSLTQAQWHRELASATAMIYPGAVGPYGGFREISCIAAMEAMAVGTPVVAVAKGAVVETPGGRGDAQFGAVLVGDESTECGSPNAIRAFADALVPVLTDDLRWRHLHTGAQQRGDQLGWDAVAAQWEADWFARLDGLVADPWRLERHWQRTGEQEGLRWIASDSR